MVYRILIRRCRLLVPTALLATLSAGISHTFAQSVPSGETGIVADALAPFDGDFAEIQLDGKRQYLHRSGRITVDKLVQYGAPICIVVKNGAYGAINQKGDVIADFTYDRIYYEYDDNGKTDDEREYHYFLAVVQLNGKFGAVDTLGNVIAQPIYDELRPINGWVIAAQQSGKWGLLSLNDGSKVLPFEYDGLDKEYILNGCIEVTVGNNVGLRSADGQHELVPPLYGTLRVLPLSGDTLIVAEQGDNTVLLDTLGHTVAAIQYNHVQADGERIRVEKDGKRGWLTTGGDVIIPPAYDESSEWRSGLCVVSRGGRKGVIAADGTTILPCEYDDIQLIGSQGSVFGEPRAILAEEHGKQGLFNTNGQPILPVRYDNIRLAEAGTVGYIWAVDGNNYCIFDLEGKELVPAIYQLPPEGYRPSIQGMPATVPVVALPDGERTGLYDLEKAQWILKPEDQQLEWQLGSFIKATRYKEDEYQIPVSAYFTSDGTQLVAPEEYLFVDAVDTDRYVVKESAGGYWKTELFDRSGKRLYGNKDWDFDVFRFNKLLVPDSVSTGNKLPHYRNGWLKVSAEDNLFVDRSGREHRFDGLDYVSDFYNGKAIAAKEVDGKEQIGIIDTAGNIVLPIVYTGMDKLYDSDLIQVSHGEKAGLVNISGGVRIEAIYDQVDRINRQDQSSLFNVRSNGKAGVVDEYGGVIIPLEYENIQFHDTFFLVTAQGKKGFVALDGTVLVAPQYDEVRLNDSYSGYFPALVQQGDHWTYIDPTNTGQPFHIIGKTKSGY